MDRVVITRETFRKLKFRDPAPGEWILTWHPNLTRFRRFEKSIVVGVCETLAGRAFLGALRGRETLAVEYPPDQGMNGMCECDFDFDHGTVYVRSMCGGGADGSAPFTHIAPDVPEREPRR